MYLTRPKGSDALSIKNVKKNAAPWRDGAAYGPRRERGGPARANNQPEMAEWHDFRRLVRGYSSTLPMVVTQQILSQL